MGQGQACKGSCKHLPGNWPCPCLGLGANMPFIPFPLLLQSVSSRVTMETPLLLRPSPASLWFLSAAEAGRDSFPAPADSGPTSDLAQKCCLSSPLATGALSTHLCPDVYSEHRHLPLRPAPDPQAPLSCWGQPVCHSHTF